MWSYAGMSSTTPWTSQKWSESSSVCAAHSDESLGGVLSLLDRGQVAEPDVSWAQPFPAGRVLFHYRWGLPRLSAWLAGAVLAAERLIGRLVPTERWAYMIITTVKTASGKPVVSESV